MTHRASMDIPVELLVQRDTAAEVVLSVEFTYREGSPAHWGDMNYPGHPADPPEVEITAIYWPIYRMEKGKEVLARHFAMPEGAIPDELDEAIYDHIISNYDPAIARAEGEDR